MTRETHTTEQTEIRPGDQSDTSTDTSVFSDDLHAISDTSPPKGSDMADRLKAREVQFHLIII